MSKQEMEPIKFVGNIQIMKYKGNERLYIEIPKDVRNRVKKELGLKEIGVTLSTPVF